MVSVDTVVKVRAAVQKELPCTCQFYDEDVRVGPCPQCDLIDGVVMAVMKVLMNE